MDNEDGYFDEQAAARYDEQSADMFEPGAVDPVVEVLAKLAGGGRALELGIGTGRIALPLARRGAGQAGRSQMKMSATVTVAAGRPGELVEPVVRRARSDPRPIRRRAAVRSVVWPAAAPEH